MYKELQQVKLSHNNFDAGVRGEWRKFNPYNPYVEQNNQKQQENLKVESLDDLFTEDDLIINANNTQEDGNAFMENTSKQPDNINVNNSNNDSFFEESAFSDITSNEQDTNHFEESVKPFKDDISKELEEKFDEIFGPLNVNNN